MTQATVTRLQAGAMECLLQHNSNEPVGFAYIGARLGETLPPGGFTQAQSGNLIAAHSETPLLPDPAQGWAGMPAWHGPDPSQAWSTAIEKVGEDRVVANHQHPQGHELEYHLQAVSDGLFCLSLIGTYPTSNAGGLLRLSIPLPSYCTQALTFGGRWAGELSTSRVSLASGVRVSNRAGSRIAHDAFPGMVVGENDFGLNHGQVLGAQLGWWGNYTLEIERTRTDAYRLAFVLDPNELEQIGNNQFVSPPMYFGLSPTGLNGLRVVFQDGVRQVRRENGVAFEGKVQLNTWEGVYFDHDPQRLMRMADKAAQLGFERFVLDDGWFGRRTDDSRGLGDWLPRPDVYPQGLDELIDHVTTSGLEFGLWFEPEMVNADSELFEAHPDWVLGEKDQPLGRNQYGLNLCNPDCFEYIQSALSRVLSDPRICSVKWDMNRDLPQAAGRPIAPAAYKLIACVLEKHPQLEIEACASGGGRIDMSALVWCNRVWLSDAHDPDIRTPMMAAYSLFAPAELMGCHIGPEASHQTGRRWSIHTRASMAVLGSMGMELDPLTLSAEDAGWVRDYIKLHCRHRTWMRHGHMLEIAHPDTGLIALGVFSAARDAALIFVLQTAPRSQSVPAQLQIPHLKGDVQVAAPLQDPAIKRSAQEQPTWLAPEGLLTDANFLANHGLMMPILSPMRGVLIEITAA